MECNPPNRCSSERGAAYLLAIVTLLVGLTLSLALLRVSGHHFLVERSRADKEAAKYVAEAGIDYAASDILQHDASPPYIKDIALANGQFHVTASDDSIRDQGAVLITSIGRANGSTYTARRVIRGAYDPMPPDYGLCLNSGLTTGTAISSFATSPGIRVNGLVNLTSVNNNITSGVWSTLTIVALGNVQPQYPFSSNVDFPAIDYNKYKSAAAVSLVGDQTFGDLSCSQPTVIHVTGNVTLSGGQVSGLITIAATGTITVMDSEDPAGDSDYLALVTTQSIDIDASVNQTRLIAYCHNSANTGAISVSLAGGFSNVGSLCADRLLMRNAVPSSVLNCERNENLSRTIIEDLKLPGTF